MSLFFWFFLSWLIYTFSLTFLVFLGIVSLFSFFLFFLFSTALCWGLFGVLSHAFASPEGNPLVQESENLASHWKREIRDKQYSIVTLEKELARWLEVIELMPFPVLMISPHGNILFSNRAFRNTFEARNFCWEIPSYQFTKALDLLLRNKGGESVPISIQNKHFVLLLFPLTENQFLLIMIDKTDEILREEREREFITHAAHELKTPLSVIQGYLEFLEPTLRDDQKKEFEIIRQHTMRLARLSRDLLSLNRVEFAPLSLETMNFSEMIRRITVFFQPRFEEKNIILSQELPQEDVFIEAEMICIEQVLFNLLENALRYTDTGEVKLILRKEHDTITFICQDTGIGIPEKDIPLLFQRFYVVDKSRSRQTGGTGLGLAIVKGIVTRHHGTISVESSRGKGSAFIITLPMRQPQELE